MTEETRSIKSATRNLTILQKPNTAQVSQRAPSVRSTERSPATAPATNPLEARSIFTCNKNRASTIQQEGPSEVRRTSLVSNSKLEPLSTPTQNKFADTFGKSFNFKSNKPNHPEIDLLLNASPMQGYLTAGSSDFAQSTFKIIKNTNLMRMQLD